jgi:hypothetical protein
MIRRSLIATAGLALVLLAGCHSEPEPVQVTEETNEAPEVAEPAPAPAPTPPPMVKEPEPAAAIATETNFEEPAPEPVDPSDQTLEDADATGLTTRAKRSDDESTQPATNEGGSGQ